MVLPPDFSSLSEMEQQRLSAATNFKQMENVISSLEGVIQDCFSECVVDLTQREIQKEEGNCLKKCHQKWFESMQRMSFRLGEEQLKLKISLDKS